jgi:hypothetical protein
MRTLSAKKPCRLGSGQGLTWEGVIYGALKITLTLASTALFSM